MSSPTGSGIGYRGLKELIAFNTKLADSVRQIILTSFKKFGKQMYEETQQKVPVRTGRLKRSGGWTVGNLFLSVFYNEYYAYYVDQGTSRFSGRHYLPRFVLMCFAICVFISAFIFALYDSKTL